MDKKKKACLIDISRFRVPLFDRMKKMIANVSELGYNQIFFNIEHSFKIEEEPFVGKEADGFTAKEFKELDNFAISKKIELIPVFQSFGHMFHILKWDKYEHLSESSQKWSVVINEETYSFFDKFYKVLSQTFSSKFIHVGGDEVYDMTTDKSKHLLNGKTKTEIFADHIFRLKQIAEKYNKEIMIWGDMVQKDENILKKLGKDINICYWMYDFAEIPDIYKKISNNIYICPGTSTWKSFFPRIDYAIKNMNLKNREYQNLNAYGFIITDWGDAGHIHPISFTEKMFEIGAKIFVNNDLNPQKISNKKALNKLILLLNKIHYADYLNSEVVYNRSEYITKHLFHDLIFQGKGFSLQSENQLNLILEKNIEIQNLSKSIAYTNEFEKDIKLFVDQTNIFAEKVKIHLLMRKNEKYSIIKEKIEDFIIGLRKWFADYMKQWLLTSQPMGLYFHIHFIKKIETDMLKELLLFKTNPNYSNLEKINIYKIPEYLNLFSVGKFESLNYLWQNFRL